MTFEKIIQTIIGDTNDERAEGFLRFLSSKLWGLYNDYLMDKIKVAESEIVWNLNMPNAKENQIYNQTVEMPKVSSAQLPEVEILLNDVVGLEQDIHGLQLMVAPDKHSFAITGTPTLEHFRKDGATALSTFELTLKYHFSGMEMPAERPVLERKVQFVINQDPRKLWRDIPVDWENMTEPKYKKDDIQIDYVKVEALSDGTPQKDIVAASKRGRSHAQEGKPRDDHFKMSHMDNGWYIMAVADGAGSAKYSREGSRIACEEVTNYCMAQLANSKDFESAVKQYNEHKTESESDARKAVGDYIYKIVGTAAFKAHKSINAEAAIKKLPAKQYATTLLLAICKKFEFGWFIATFWVGDGAICLYNKQAHTAEVLGVPDEGEYAGQTRFLTMPEIFKDATSLYQRLRFRIVDDFTALFLMSDGVSDPKFETDANLNNPDKWDALWTDLKENGVELTDDNEETKNQLLAWLDFWSPGNHDDRTIAILYEGEDVSQNISSETADEDNTSIPDVPETTSNEEEIAETPVEPSSTEDIEEQDQSAAEDVEPQKE
ncbi:MAG: protein phosphatase 2C domain-containing protein [Muribaculaceae bacterium]|nr:protein phosphatase 2C domain-containing protein [Muribaculum sp.]MCM1294892.1 protein phosphatase 2C domain-containing protein [Muribaculaceae bacterium]